eukprot:COSAG03_NODE_2454_length_2741_cov_5.927113_1_plen_444_part_10
MQHKGTDPARTSGAPDKALPECRDDRSEPVTDPPPISARSACSPDDHQVPRRALRGRCPETQGRVPGTARVQLYTEVEVAGEGGRGSNWETDGRMMQAASHASQLSDKEQFYMRANKLYEAIAKVLHEVLRVRFPAVYPNEPWQEPAGDHEDFLIGRAILHGSADATCSPVDKLGGDVTAKVRNDGFVVLSSADDTWERVKNRWKLKLIGNDDGVSVQGIVQKYKPTRGQPQVPRGFVFVCDICKGNGLSDCTCGLGKDQECTVLMQYVSPLGKDNEFREGKQARLKLLNEGEFAGKGISCMDITGMNNLLIDLAHTFLNGCTDTFTALGKVNDTRNAVGMHLSPHEVTEEQFKTISDTMETFVKACKDEGILDHLSPTVQAFEETFKQYVTEESMFVKWTKADYEAALLSHYGDRVHFRKTKSQEWNSKPKAMFEMMIRENWQ